MSLYYVNSYSKFFKIFLPCISNFLVAWNINVVENKFNHANFSQWIVKWASIDKSMIHGFFYYLQLDNKVDLSLSGRVIKYGNIELTSSLTGCKILGWLENQVPKRKVNLNSGEVIIKSGSCCQKTILSKTQICAQFKNKYNHVKNVNIFLNF